MAWYRGGTVAVTNGSPVVTGTGTAWVANVQPGHAINLPDGKAYEVLSISSDTQIVLGSAYLGGTANGQSYSVQPNQGFAQTAATRLSEFLTQVSGWVAGALSGRFGDGSSQAPGIGFAADQDTGFRRGQDNTLTLVTGGGDRLTADNAGNLGLGTVSPFNVNGKNFEIIDALVARLHLVAGGASGRRWWFDSLSNGTLSLTDGTSSIQRMVFDSSGNMLIGVGSGSNHEIAKPVSESTPIVMIRSTTTGQRSAMFYGVAGSDAWAGSGAACYLGRNSSTNRSINAGGTLNATGADYAEYMTKADGCGPIGKGDVCGVDAEGRLTKSWAAAISFVVKSTDPAYVGGDSWSSHLGSQPEEPPPAPEAPEPPMPAEDVSPDERDAAMNAYRDAVAAYGEAKVAHDAAVARYAEERPAWDAQLEAARQCVDRIAFSGQVPVNVVGDFAVGDYLIAVSKGSGIRAVAVAEKDITFEQYRRRLGKVWAIRDGRPWVDVQHG